MKNIKSTKNANKANKANTATSNEGYGLGSGKDAREGFMSDAIASKAFTAWGVEVDGKISPFEIVDTRSLARYLRNEAVEVFGTEVKCSVRKLLILPIAGR